MCACVHERTPEVCVCAGLNVYKRALNVLARCCAYFSLGRIKNSFIPWPCHSSFSTKVSADKLNNDLWMPFQN